MESHSITTQNKNLSTAVRTPNSINGLDLGSIQNLFTAKMVLKCVELTRQLLPVIYLVPRAMENRDYLISNPTHPLNI